ncbi:electron transfer flavoprotein beta subunit lysine methyltransferase-like [Saccoglossus kowalevskii]|uniref:ETFB lysine methyltransferase n=1 Tax=Saccoglossus kowalevskii TaxID=10224 RepID=A0ABM0GSN0_SACKO|nr:PREDICTED: methyltransferase-like protein 20-like [Saccoglossus kowalevskii]
MRVFNIIQSSLRTYRVKRYVFQSQLECYSRHATSIWRNKWQHYRALPTGVTKLGSEQFIIKNTMATTDHLTPEINLRLMTPQCKLYHCKFDDTSGVSDPYWAFYWPGGQVLTRFLLDNPSYVIGKNILDVGSGCGATAIACIKLGANNVLANDIDPVAEKAIHLNAELNGVSIETSTENMIGKVDTEFDTIILGDMFYDESFTKQVTDWLLKLLSLKRKMIMIGDPGRVFLNQLPIRKHLHQLEKYRLTEQCKFENHGFNDAAVWTIK